MLEPSFGAVNLEDISQPNCYKVLDTLREECEIPVWHDDAQGTGSVTLAGLINALRIVDKPIGKVRIVFYGAGASNTTIARLILMAGADPAKMVMFDTKGGLHKERDDIKADAALLPQVGAVRADQPGLRQRHRRGAEGRRRADRAQQAGPGRRQAGVDPRRWRRSRSCSPARTRSRRSTRTRRRKPGAYIVATGRGDFPNQVNNSMGFPGILKGALLVRARKITDEMAIAAAYSVANFAEKKGITPDYIMPTMDETEVFAEEAADVAMTAIANGVARVTPTRDEVYAQTLAGHQGSAGGHRPADAREAHRRARSADAGERRREGGRAGDEVAAARPRRIRPRPVTARSDHPGRAGPRSSRGPRFAPLRSAVQSVILILSFQW